MAESFNPYEAPQTRDLPVAALAAIPTEPASLDAPPREVKRWMNAALGLYFFSFVVPYAPWMWSARQDWHLGIGTVLCFFGLIFFWNPYVISWWANVMFWLAYRDLNRLNSGRAMCFAITGICLVPIIGVMEWNDPYIRSSNGEVDELLPGRLLLSAPYLCWVGAMLLMLIAALQLRRVANATAKPSATHQG